jgi:uncharacterized membrane protein
VLAFGAVLRLACMGAEFWLDEIWSWELAHGARSFLGVFAIRHDNSHPLNSLWLRLWPATAPLIVLRLPALVAGLGAIVLAAVVARRRGTVEAVIAATLVAGCYWTVLASAEARGYALAVFFAFAAFEVLWRYLDGRSRSSLAVFWVLSALGFLSHLTFVHAYIGFVVWSMRRFAREGETPPSSLRQISAMAILHGPVAAFVAIYYLLVVGGMEIGGGPPSLVAVVLRNLISLGLGGPDDAWGWLLVGVAIVLFAVGLSLLARAKNDVGTFFAAAVVGSPALFLIRPPAFLFERYFMISFVFFLLLVAFVLGDLWRRSSLRPVALALLVGFLVGNVYRVLAFAEAGRGEFGEALAWIAARDPDDLLLLAGDHDLGVRLYADFYARRQSLPRVRYLVGKESKNANWFLDHRTHGDERPALTDYWIGPTRFVRVKAYPSRGRASCGWYVYRRIADLPE